MKESKWFCYKCFSANPLPVESRCPQCGGRISKRKMSRITEESERIVIFGYLYRELYESLYLTSNGQVRYHHPEFDIPLRWVATAIASGVLGNLATDLIKVAVKKILRLVPKKDKSGLGSIDRLRSDEEIEKLIGYFKDYQKGFKGINPKVAAAIEEEERVHTLTELIDIRKITITSDSSIKPFAAEILRAQRKVERTITNKRKKKLTTQDFK